MHTIPRIGVTGHDKCFAPSWWCIALALLICGAKPVRISLKHRPKNEQFDAFIISGGNDISPEHYQGDINNKVKHDPKRDELEIKWIEKTVMLDIPLLGICRGAQLINVVLGGDLYADIRDQRRKTYNRPGLLPTKQVILQNDSQVATLLNKKRLRVNSLHHQAIKTPGDNIQIVGWDRDHIVQVIESPTYRILGVQWHPEYLIYLPSQLRLFHWLVHSSKANTSL